LGVEYSRNVETEMVEIVGVIPGTWDSIPHIRKFNPAGCSLFDLS